jgi:hypothetical protein
LLEPGQRSSLLVEVLVERAGLDRDASRNRDQTGIERDLEMLGLHGRRDEEEVAQPRLGDRAGELGVLPAEALERGARRGRRLRADSDEHLLDARGLRPCLGEMRGERPGEQLGVRLPLQQRQQLEGERPLDPERLGEQLQKEVARIAQRRRDGELLRSCPVLFRASSPASRSASAMIASAGFADPCVGKTLPSATNRFGTPQAR